MKSYGLDQQHPRPSLNADKLNTAHSLDVNNLSFSYKDHEILHNITLKLQGPGLTAVLGPNGAGKTTLLRCMIKMLNPQKGTITLDGKALSNLSVRETAKWISYVAQNNEAKGISVFDAVLLGRLPHIGMRAGKGDQKAVQHMLRRLDLEDFALRSLWELSGGELQKVSIARALVQQTPFILLDEPTASLDLKNQLHILAILKKAAYEQNVHVLISIHDLNTAFRFADRFLFLKGGKITSDVDRAGLTSDMVHEVYEVPVTMRRERDIPVVTPKV